MLIYILKLKETPVHSTLEFSFKSSILFSIPTLDLWKLKIIF
jgi:hypothetical protein